MSFNIQVQFENQPPEWIQREAHHLVREIVDYVVLRYFVLPRQRHTLHVFHNGRQVGETERIGDLIGRNGLENRFVVTRNGLTSRGAHDGRVRIVTPGRALQRTDAHDDPRFRGGQARDHFVGGLGSSLLPPQTSTSTGQKEEGIIILARLSRMTKIELKAQCRVRGISQQGTKQELIHRLMSLI